MTQLVQAQPDLGDRILAAERRRASRWRIEFLVVWLVILAGMIAFILITVDLDAGFITKVVPFIVGGVGVTLLISFSSIALAIILAALGALGRLSRNPIANGDRELLCLAGPGDAAPPADPLHLPGAAAGGPGAGRLRLRRHRPRLQLRRLHDRDLPRRHPGRARRPDRGGRVAGDERPDHLLPDHRAPGLPDRHPGDRQRLHRDAQGLVARLRRSASTRSSSTPRSRAGRPSSRCRP